MSELLPSLYEPTSTKSNANVLRLIDEIVVYVPPSESRLAAEVLHAILAAHVPPTNSPRQRPKTLWTTESNRIPILYSLGSAALPLLSAYRDCHVSLSHRCEAQAAICHVPCNVLDRIRSCLAPTVQRSAIDAAAVPSIFSRSEPSDPVYKYCERQFNRATKLMHNIAAWHAHFAPETLQALCIKVRLVPTAHVSMHELDCGENVCTDAIACAQCAAGNHTLPDRLQSHAPAGAAQTSAQHRL